MSEVPKTVEEPVAATETPLVEAPVAAAAVPETETAVPATTEEVPVAETNAAEETKPVEEGILGYKGPGLLKSLIFSKKFFYFGSEPVEAKALHTYLRGEKAQEIATHNAAWASETGKGLLYFAKDGSEKAQPAGLFNLSEISDIVTEGTLEFAFTSGSHKHTFKAASLAERDNWVATLKTKVTEAETLKPTVTESEKYKESLATLSKPAVAAVVASKSPEKAAEKEEKKEAKEEKKEEKAAEKEEKKEEKKEIKEEKKEEKVAEKAEKKDRTKSRSASRKRNSIFGSFLGKKEEKTEAEKEAPVVESTAEEPVAPVAEEAVAPAVPETTEAAPVTEETPAVAETRPAPAAKRNSIFGNFKNSFNKKTDAPVVPAKDAEPVSETAPVIPAVESSEPLAAEVSSPANVPTETTELPVINGETKTETSAAKADKRKSSLPFFGAKKAITTSDEETAPAEKQKSPLFAKIRDTVKGKKSPKAPADEKTVEPALAEEAVKTEEAPAVAEPAVVSEPEPVIKDSTPAVAASA